MGRMRMGACLAWKSNFSEMTAAWQTGNREAGNAIFAEIEQELMSIAAAKLNQERQSSLSTGDLINEAIIRLSQLTEMKFQSKAHVLALASRIMKQVLVDQARKKRSDKRDHIKVTLITNLPDWESPVDLLDINLILEELRELDAERADIVEMRFFGGMSTADIAAVLEISERTVKRRWASTRAWLQRELRHES
jgi:RNA polymerase sigma factor (TIGR02999 family)